MQHGAEGLPKLTVRFGESQACKISDHAQANNASLQSMLALSSPRCSMHSGTEGLTVEGDGASEDRIVLDAIWACGWCCIITSCSQ